jgi:K+-sensing histidine kinase KdpD
VGTGSLDEKTTVFAFRCLVFAALIALLVNSSRHDNPVGLSSYVMSGLYLFTSIALWKARDGRLNSSWAQGLAYLWDVGVVTASVYSSEGFDNELYLMYFLIMFMSGLMTQVGQSFLIGTVSSLMYAALWFEGKTAVDLPLENLLLRFAFFYIVAFFTAIMAHRVRSSDKRVKTLELRLALERLANGGWGLEVDERLDPEIKKTVLTLNALLDNLSRALEKLIGENEDLRRAMAQARSRPEETPTAQIAESRTPPS